MESKPSFPEPHSDSEGPLRVLVKYGMRAQHPYMVCIHILMVCLLPYRHSTWTVWERDLLRASVEPGSTWEWDYAVREAYADNIGRLGRVL